MPCPGCCHRPGQWVKAVCVPLKTSRAGIAWHVDYPRDVMRVFFTESETQSGPGFYSRRPVTNKR
jgi:hypothetical protein